jgi:pimeloyl-ACP methyl ester carboxylesterase
MDERWREVAGDGGVRLAVRVVPGPDRPRATLVLHHGLASSQRIWDLLLPSLARRFRVVTFDARGHGRSAKPTSGYGFATTTADLAAVVRATRLRGRPVVVAGHSWGAMVALEAAVRHPRAVAGIYLVDGGVGSLGEEMTWPEVKMRLAPPDLTGTPVETFRRMMRTYWGDALDVTPAVEDIVLSLMRVRPDGTITPYLTRANHFRILRAIWEQDPFVLHARLRVPAEALLAVAPGDPVRAARRRDAAARIRGAGGRARLTWLEGIHDLPLQRPADVARRLQRFALGAVG